MIITEIINRSDQGVTRPYLCRSEAGDQYYVKGRHAGFRSLCCELVAGRLAQELELPIPEFEIAHVPEHLILERS